MLNRFRQFFSALNARLGPRDHSIVADSLTAAERRLFYAMDLVDQRHSLDVAGSILSILSAQSHKVDKDLLIKAALLHDVGKRQGDLKLWDRVLVVLIGRFFPAVFSRLSAKPGSAFFIAVNHPEIGAGLCHKAGSPGELIRLVRLHHSGGPGRELEILMAADQQN